MPSTPSAPSSLARSRAGTDPDSYQSASSGFTRSSTKRRTVSRIARSSSPRRSSVPNSAKGSSGVAIVGRLLQERAHTGLGATDEQLLDLAGAFVERHHPRVPQVLLHRVLVDVAVAAV